MNQHDRQLLSITLTAELSYWLSVADGNKPLRPVHIKSVLQRLEKDPEVTEQIETRLNDMRTSPKFDEVWAANLELHKALLSNLRKSSGFSDVFRLRMALASLRQAGAISKLGINESEAASLKGFVVLVSDEELTHLDENENIKPDEFIAVSIFGSPFQINKAKVT